MSEFLSNEPPESTTRQFEPVMRKDGTVVRLVALEDDFLFVYDDALRTGYTGDDVIVLGDGNYDRGTARIGSTHYQNGHDKLLDTDIAFQEELNRHYVG